MFNSKVKEMENEIKEIKQSISTIEKSLIKLETYIGVRKEIKEKNLDILKWVSTILSSGLSVAILNYYLHFLPTK